MTTTETLNPQQQAAVEHDPEGVLLKRALAGSGKTRTLRFRIRHVLRVRDEQHERGSRVLALVFGNRVAAELRGALERMLPPEDLKRVFVSTTHAEAMRMLGKFQKACPPLAQAPRWEIPKEHHLAQALVDWAEAEHLARLSPGQVRMLMSIDAEAMSFGADPLNICIDANPKTLEFLKMSFDQMVMWIERFKEWRYANGQLLFADVLPLANQLPGRCFALMNYKDVMADELQDLNFQQRAFIGNFMRYARSFTGVGDENQAIFGFCGADAAIFSRMKEQFPEAQTLQLEYNYRSTEQILALGNKILEHEIGTDLRLKGRGAHGPEPVVYTNGAEGLIHWMQARAASGEEWRDMAVLYRTKSQALQLEMALAASGIPYVLCDAGFFDQAVVHDVVAYLHTFYNPRPAFGEWRRIFNHFAGVGETAAKYVWERTEGKPATWSGRSPSFYSGERLKHWDAFWEAIEGYKKLALKGPKELVDAVTEALTPGWSEFYGSMGPRQLDDTLRNAGAFAKWVKDFSDNATGWDVVQALVAMERGNRKIDEATNAVRIMTLHKAKGLEWPSVALWNVDDGTLPLVNVSPAQAAEERRLLYVGVTRAMRHLALICPNEAARESTLAKYVVDPEKLLAKALDLKEPSAKELWGF